MATVEEIQARRDARKATRAKARDEQRAKDLEALDALEEEHGDGLVKEIELADDMFFDGLPTMAVVRCPTGPENTRYEVQCKNAKANVEKLVEAGHTLGKACLVYPSKEVYAQLLEKVSTFHTRVSKVAVLLGQGGKEREGKG